MWPLVLAAAGRRDTPNVKPTCPIPAPYSHNLSSPGSKHPFYPDTAARDDAAAPRQRPENEERSVPLFFMLIGCLCPAAAI
jgi:hypothetical protein